VIIPVSLFSLISLLSLSVSTGTFGNRLGRFSISSSAPCWRWQSSATLAPPFLPKLIRTAKFSPTHLIRIVGPGPAPLSFFLEIPEKGWTLCFPPPLPLRSEREGEVPLSFSFPSLPLFFFFFTYRCFTFLALLASSEKSIIIALTLLFSSFFPFLIRPDGQIRPSFLNDFLMLNFNMALGIDVHPLFFFFLLSLQQSFSYPLFFPFPSTLTNDRQRGNPSFPPFPVGEEISSTRMRKGEDSALSFSFLSATG